MTDIDGNGLNDATALSIVRRLVAQARRLDLVSEALVNRVLEDTPVRQALAAAAAAVTIVLSAALPIDALDSDDALGDQGRHARTVAAATASPTTRELEVISLISQGLSHKQVAERLNITRHTVANHVAHVRTKLNATGAEHAVAIAIRSGLV